MRVYVISNKDIEIEEGACYQASLTESECEKIVARTYPNANRVAFQGGQYYTMEIEGGEAWLSFPDLTVFFFSK